MTNLDARETLFLELVNRARMDPLGEAARYRLVDLNTNLAAGTISAAPKQILSFNSDLSASAQAHAEWMNAVDTFSHTGVNGTTPTERMQNAGYTLGGSYRTAENIAWSGSTSQASYNANAEVLAQHESLFLSEGHRHNILTDDLRELGVGTDLGVFRQNGTDFFGMMSAFNFARAGAAYFVSGVSYNDADNSDFYSIGEGQGERTIQLLSGASVVASTMSQAAGAFSLATSVTGTMEIVFSGGGLSASEGASFSMGAENTKIDLVNGNTIETNTSATLTRSALNLRLIGIENINATGNNLANVLTGNKGDNTLAGGGGNDKLVGGAGSDTAVFPGVSSSYAISFDSARSVYTFSGSDGDIDTVQSVENFQFSNETLSVSQLKLSNSGPQPPPPPQPPPSTGAHVVQGTSASEVLRGTDGVDRIFGYAGADTIVGLNGADILTGGTGQDRLKGGLGEDQFNFTSSVITANADRIIDFNAADDMIGLRKSVFKAIGSTFSSSEFYKGSAAHDSNDHIIYNAATGALSYDSDGNGNQTAHLFATVNKGLTLTYQDFLLI